MKKINFSTQIKSKIKSLQFGLVEAHNISVETSDEFLEEELQLLTQFLLDKFGHSAPSDDPTVSAVRRMYRQVGWEPTKYRPSSEALIRRIIQGKGLYRINNLVDFGNIVSAHYHIPMGLYDLEKIEGAVFIDTGHDGEVYEGISKPQINAGGKIILRDELGVFGNPTADSVRTSIQKNTQHILAVFFCPATLEKTYIRKILDALVKYYCRYTSSASLQTDIDTIS